MPLFDHAMSARGEFIDRRLEHHQKSFGRKNAQCFPQRCHVVRRIVQTRIEHDGVDARIQERQVVELSSYTGPRGTKMPRGLKAILVVATQVDGARFVPQVGKPVTQPTGAGAQIEYAQSRAHGRQHSIPKTRKRTTPDAPLPCHWMIVRAVRQIAVKSGISRPASFGEPDLRVVGEEVLDGGDAFRAEHMPHAVLLRIGVAARATVGSLVGRFQCATAQGTSQSDQTRSSSSK